MARFARIEDGEVREIVTFDPAGRFHPSLLWVECPEEVGERWLLGGDTFEPPPVVEPTPDPIDPQSALLEALADEWEQAATDLRAGKPERAAEALERAAGVARGAARA